MGVIHTARRGVGASSGRSPPAPRPAPGAAGPSTRTGSSKPSARAGRSRRGVAAPGLLLEEQAQPRAANQSRAGSRRRTSLHGFARGFRAGRSGDAQACPGGWTTRRTGGVWTRGAPGPCGETRSGTRLRSAARAARAGRGCRPRPAACPRASERCGGSAGRCRPCGAGSDALEGDLEHGSGFTTRTGPKRSVMLRRTKAHAPDLGGSGPSRPWRHGRLALLRQTARV